MTDTLKPQYPAEIVHSLTSLRADGYRQALAFVEEQYRLERDRLTGWETHTEGLKQQLETCEKSIEEQRLICKRMQELVENLMLRETSL